MKPEYELWKATSEKNLEKVEEILQNHPSLNINWGDPEYERTPLYRACGYAGSPEIVKRLLLHPAILPNQPYKKGATPFYIASQQGHAEILRVLLDDDRIDPTIPDTEEVTPFYIACCNRRVECVRLLLEDDRIDPNTPKANNTSPLWMAAQEGYDDVIREMFARSVTIDTGRVSLWNNTTAEQWAEIRHNDVCAALIRHYAADPFAAQTAARRSLLWDGASLLFSLFSSFLFFTKPSLFLSLCLLSLLLLSLSISLLGFSGYFCPYDSTL